jgi:hypothetical protein
LDVEYKRFALAIVEPPRLSPRRALDGDHHQLQALREVIHRRNLKIQIQSKEKLKTFISSSLSKGDLNGDKFHTPGETEAPVNSTVTCQLLSGERYTAGDNTFSATESYWSCANSPHIKVEGRNLKAMENDIRELVTVVGKLEFFVSGQMTETVITKPKFVEKQHIDRAFPSLDDKKAFWDAIRIHTNNLRT